MEIAAIQKTPTKKSKYGNTKVEVDNIKFDSRKEANYYGKLKILQKAGEVTSFELQPKYDLIINGVKCGFYKADFRVTWKSGDVRIVDVKGLKLPIYNLKKKLVEALYAIKIIEV